MWRLGKREMTWREMGEQKTRWKIMLGGLNEKGSGLGGRKGGWGSKDDRNQKDHLPEREGMNLLLMGFTRSKKEFKV